jgi:hypothetical protein
VCHSQGTGCFTAEYAKCHAIDKKHIGAVEHDAVLQQRLRLLTLAAEPIEGPIQPVFKPDTPPVNHITFPVIADKAVCINLIRTVVELVLAEVPLNAFGRMCNVPFYLFLAILSARY